MAIRKCPKCEGTGKARWFWSFKQFCATCHGTGNIMENDPYRDFQDCKIVTGSVKRPSYKTDEQSEVVSRGADDIPVIAGTILPASLMPENISSLTEDSNAGQRTETGGGESGGDGASRDYSDSDSRDSENSDSGSSSDSSSDSSSSDSSSSSSD